MKTIPHISVCMPMYNASRYLRECIDSVLGQTFHDFEFLIVDDGSTDDSVEIVESYTDPRIRLIRREHDYIASLNCLIDEARGEYIARMDADDVMLPNRLQQQFDYMESHPLIAIIGGDVCPLSEQPVMSDVMNETTDELHLLDFSHNNVINNPTSFMRLQSIKRFRLKYDLKFKFCEDYKFWIDALCCGLRINYIHIPFTAYRENPEQVSNKYAQEMLSSSNRIKHYCQDILANSTNSDYIEPVISATSNQLTIIIPFLNEGNEIVNTVENIRNNWLDYVDILVVNDHSYDGVDYRSVLSPYNVYYFFNSSRMGVAASRDFAISKIKTPYFLLLDGHMRLYDKYNYSKIVSILSNCDRCILCAQSIPLVRDSSNELVLLDGYDKGYGAYIPLSKDALQPDVRWCDKEHDPTQDIEEIPTVLGAAYAASVRYWHYINGLTGLKGYGFDEAYISEKVWREGGKCLLLKNFITGHLYRKNSPYETFSVEMAYNSMFICGLLFPKTILHWTMSYAMAHDYISFRHAYALFTENIELVNSLRTYNDAIFTKTYESIRSLHEHEIQAEADRSLVRLCVSHKYPERLLNTILTVQDPNIYDGLGSILLYLIECEPQATALITQTLSKLISVCERGIAKQVLEIGFEGLSGIGWVLLRMTQERAAYIGFDVSTISPILHNIDKYIAEHINLIDGSNRQCFERGYGGILCYTICRIQYNSSTEQASSLINQACLFKLYEIAKLILSTSGYDMRSYFMALQYVSVIENDNEWVPSITDCLTLPSALSDEQNFNSLTNGIVGYALLSHIVLCKHEKD